MKKEYISPALLEECADPILLLSSSMFDRPEQDEIDIHIDEGLTPGQAMSRRREWDAFEDDYEEDF